MTTARTSGAAPALPLIPAGITFAPWPGLGGRASVVVDAQEAPGSVLTLSHHPASGTPAAVRADTSTEIVARFLDLDPLGRTRADDAVMSNDHYDEDGLFGLWMLSEQPTVDDPARTLACEAAAAGDFAVWSRPEAAWCAIAAIAIAEGPTTPLPAVRRALARSGGRDPAGDLYLAVLPRTRRMLDDPERFRRLWEPRWSRVEDGLAQLDAGAARIEEHPDADLAVVWSSAALDDLAIFPRTAMTRVLLVHDGGVTLRYRYETWVDFASRPLSPRLPLAPLARHLGADETGGEWRCDHEDQPRPRLWSADADGRPAPPEQDRERVVATVADYLGGGGP